MGIKTSRKSIVQGKTYDTGEITGMALYKRLQDKLRLRGCQETQVFETPEQSRYGKEQIVRPRIGQGAFKVLITDAYHRRCTITGEKTLPVLEAAHIKPYSMDGLHEISNGLLLKKDFHTLFDRGYITVDRNLTVEVSRRIKRILEMVERPRQQIVVSPGTQRATSKRRISRMA